MWPVSLSLVESLRLTCLYIGTTSSNPCFLGYPDSCGAFRESIGRFWEEAMKTRTLPGLSLRAFVIAAVVAALSVAGLAQITTTGIRGITRDQSGAVIPNATIKLVDNSTGVERATVSSSDGGFLIPNLQFGSYKLTVTASGFQTMVIAAITVESGRTTDVSVDMKVGAAAETVQVAASAEQLNTTTTEVGGTINNKLVRNLPFGNRDGLGFAGLIAGNARSSSQRNSTYNGLPNASLNITLDGMNNNSQRFKSGGTSFFAFAPARIDAIEEVSVSTTGLGADVGGEGAMQIRMTTKRGTDQRSEERRGGKERNARGTR